MMSPYLELCLRSLDEAVEEKPSRELRLRHKINQVGTKTASVIKAKDFYCLRPRRLTKPQEKFRSQHILISGP